MAKYIVYGNYTFPCILGEYEADSEDEAIQMALDDADPDMSLCYECSRKFSDSGMLDEESCMAEIK